MELYDNSTLEKIQEEIKAKVFERYSEIQGVKTQANEMNATLDALHEVTQIPMSEIERIAAEVAQKHGLNKQYDLLIKKKNSGLGPEFLY